MSYWVYTSQCVYTHAHTPKHNNEVGINEYLNTHRKMKTNRESETCHPRPRTKNYEEKGGGSGGGDVALCVLLLTDLYQYIFWFADRLSASIPDHPITTTTTICTAGSLKVDIEDGTT